jgi:sulfite exporter TauE/SafE
MWSTEGLFLAFFSSGFAVGFGHCVGMCGPVVVSFSLNLKERGAILPHLLYHAGRIGTYALLGAVAGATGSFTGLTAGIVGLQKAVMIFAGAFIVFMGLAMSGLAPPGRLFGDSIAPSGLLSRGFRRLSSLRSTWSYLPLGLLLGLLPCGPVYTALLAAARAGMEAAEPGHGLLIGTGLMLSFGLGTAPALLIVGKLAGLGWLTKRQMIYRGSAIIMILVGVYFVVSAIRY